VSILKSSDDHLTLNADGSSKNILFQADGVQKASISSAGLFTSTTIDATALTGNLPAISGANLTGISSLIKYIGVATLAEDDSVTSTATSYTSTGATITVPSADAANCSKIILIFDSSVRITKDSWSHADFRIERTAPSSATYKRHTIGMANSATTAESYNYAGNIVYDESLGSGDHTYTMYFRTAHGNANAAADINYKYRPWVMIAIGI